MVLDVLERIEENERKALKRSEMKGKRDGIRETAIRMFKQGFDVDIIYKATGLKKSEIEKLKII